MARGKRKNPALNNQQVVNLDPNGQVISVPSFHGEIESSEKSGRLIASTQVPNRLIMGNPAAFMPVYERYEHISKGLMPFSMTTTGTTSLIDIQHYVELCQKAYFNVSVFRNTIDIMTEFSNSQVFFKGGNAQSRKFFENWYYNKIGGYNLTDQWFREWFRSGNVALYRFDADITTELLRKISNIYGSESKNYKGKIPIKYLLINPAFLRVDQGLNFSNQTYYKLLTNYEISKIKNPRTEEEIDFANSLSKKIKDAIQEGGNAAVFPLEADKIYISFCKKQDYEPFAVPLFFPVLEDIDLKLQFKATEKILSRTVEYAILLINVGTEDNPNPTSMAALQELFRNETIGRVLIADGTTKASFVIPELNKVIGPEKYKIVNEDIANGLLSVVFSEEKFSSASIKTKIFTERLNEARNSFLQLFLNPEIRRISKDLGFKNYPKAEMAAVDLTDQNQTNKLYSQLYQMGALTPEELTEAIENGYLPTKEESIQNQKEFKSLRDEGLYAPLMGGGAVGQEAGGANGRPTGTKNPAKTQDRQSSPIGTSKASELKGFKLEKIVEMFKNINAIYANLEKEAKKHFKVKKLNENQASVLNSLVPIILSNEKEEDWNKITAEYIKSPKMINAEVAKEIDEISLKFDTSLLLSSILRHCKENLE